MDARENSNLLNTFFDEQGQHTSPYLYYLCFNLFTLHSNSLYPLFSTMECNVLQNARTKIGNSMSFVPSESDVPLGERYIEKSDSDSSTEEGGDASDEEVSLDELLHNGKAKKKIEQLAAMVGVDTTEPAIVLTEVVRVLKHLEIINHCCT